MQNARDAFQRGERALCYLQTGNTLLFLKERRPDMRTITTFILTLAVAVSLIGCGAPANNAPANTNTNANAAPKTPAAPAAADLLALDHGATEAYFKGDSAYFETFLSDKFGMPSNGKHQTKADTIKYIAGVKCEVKDGWTLDEPQVSQIDNDTYGLTYKGTFDGTCNDGPGGKSQKIPSPIRAATVFVRSGDKWQGAYHTEVPIMEAKTDDKAANTAKKDDKADAAKPTDTKKAEPAKKEETAKKDDAKKPAANTTAAANANSAPIGMRKTAPDGSATAPAGPDANTDALVKTELSGWMAWKDKDAKALDSIAAKNLAFVDGSGKLFANRADVLKEWDNTSGCQGVSKVDLKNGYAWALSPTVEILNFDATADGSCGGMKNGTMWGVSVYVKEGDSWKIAFGVIQPAHKS